MEDEDQRALDALEWWNILWPERRLYGPSRNGPTHEALSRACAKGWATLEDRRVGWAFTLTQEGLAKVKATWRTRSR